MGALCAGSASSSIHCNKPGFTLMRRSPLDRKACSLVSRFQSSASILILVSRTVNSGRRVSYQTVVCHRSSESSLSIPSSTSQCGLAKAFAETGQQIPVFFGFQGLAKGVLG